MSPVNVLAAALVIAGAVLSCPSQSAAMEGNDFYTICREPRPPYQAWCLGYVLGLAEGTSFGVAPPACLPAEVTARQLLDVTIEYMRERPAERHWQPAASVWNAVREAWPCPEPEH